MIGVLWGDGVIREIGRPAPRIRESASPRSLPKPEPEAPQPPQSVSSVRRRTMSSVLCVLSVLTNVAVRVDSAMHQSGNCKLPRTQEAKKWNGCEEIIDP